jgi:hypothetical protein
MALASSICCFFCGSKREANEKNESRVSVLWAFGRKKKVFSFWKEKVFSFFWKEN